MKLLLDIWVSVGVSKMRPLLKKYIAEKISGMKIKNNQLRKQAIANYCLQ